MSSKIKNINHMMSQTMDCHRDTQLLKKLLDSGTLSLSTVIIFFLSSSRDANVHYIILHRGCMKDFLF